MSDFSDEERALFDAARAGYEPSSSDRDRVRSRVLARAGAAVVIGSATSAAAVGAEAGGHAAAGVASAKAGALIAKVGLWLAIGGALGVGGYGVSRAVWRDEPASLPRPAPGSVSTARAPAASAAVSESSLSGTIPSSRSAVSESSPSSAAVPSGTRDSLGAAADDGVSDRASAKHSPLGDSSAVGAGSSGAIPAAPLATAAAANDAPRAAGVLAFPSAEPVASLSSNTPSSALSVEARALARVQSELRAGQNAEALREVELQRQKFAGGALAAERDAARIVALCALGRTAEAKLAAADFLANSPRSPLVARIRSSCAAPE